MFNLIKFLLLVIFSYSLFAQEQSPPSIKWYQKNSKNFKIVFPLQLDSVANYTLNYLESIYNKSSKDLQVNVRKTPIILHNSSAISNGFVSVGPRRSEFFVRTPPQDYSFISNNNWIDLLSTHEFRHLVQIEKAYSKPINKLVYFLFGENVFRALGSAATPFWFWEGDAVDIESRLTNYGRGREPNFTRISRTNINSFGFFNYYKQTLGSYKYKTPNEYESGYIMTRYLKRNYGDSIYNKIINKTFSQSLLPFPFVRNLKKETSLNIKQLYEKSFNELIDKENTQKPKESSLNFRNSKTYKNYLYPKKYKNNELVVLVKGLKSILHFATINNNGNIKKLFTPGLILDQGFIAYSKNLLGWIEYHKDPRWGNRTYSNIKIFDLENKNFILKTKRSYYSSVDISPDGNSFIALENLSNGKSRLIFQNILSKEKTDSISLNNGAYSYVKFSDEKNKLLAIKTLNEKKQIILISLEDKKESVLYETYENIGSPVKIGSVVFFNSSINKTDQIVYTPVKSQKIYKVTNSQFGAYNPGIRLEENDFTSIKIIYNDYSAFGFDVKETPFHSSKDEIKKTTYSRRETTKLNKKYKSIRYFKWKNFIRPVDWGIYNYNGSIKGIDQVAFGVSSKDLMGNMVLSGGYLYDNDKKEGSTVFKMSYLGLYPILDLDFLKTKKKSTITNETKSYDVEWDEKELKIGLKIPLSYTRSKYTTYYIFESDYSSTKLENIYSPFFPGTIKLNYDRIKYLTNTFYYSRLHKKTKRNVYYPWGQTILLQHKIMTNRSDFSGYYFRASSFFDFPGLKETHSLRLNFNYEGQTQKGYAFANSVSLINGFESNNKFKNALVGEIEYELPVIYPHIHIGPILNIQRIRYTSFINTAIIEGVTGDDNYVEERPFGFGGELYFDVNFFRQTSVFNLGVRWSYVNLMSKPKIELLLSSITF